MTLPSLSQGEGDRGVFPTTERGVAPGDQCESMACRWERLRMDRTTFPAADRGSATKRVRVEGLAESVGLFLESARLLASRPISDGCLSKAFTSARGLCNPVLELFTAMACLGCE